MKKSYNHVLFIGAGGGNDMFSTLFAAVTMKDLGYEWQSATIAGVLSPFHAYTGLTEIAPSTFAVAKDSKRYMSSHVRKMEISFVDPAIAALTDEKFVSDLNINSAVLFDLSLGTKSLKEGIDRIAQGGLVVLVDVGGDILYTNDASKEVLSPMFDAMILSAVKQIEGSVIFLTGVGLDGEIPVCRLTTELERISPQIAHRGLLQKSDSVENLFLKRIRKVREGNTVPRLLAALNASMHLVTNYERMEEVGIDIQHNVRYQVAGRKYYFLKDHYTYFRSSRMVTCKQYFIFNADAVSNPLAVEYTDTLDWILSSGVLEGEINFEGMGQMICTQNNEIGLLVLPSHFFDDRNLIFVTKRGSIFDEVENVRQEIITESLQYLLNGEVDFLLMYKKDVDLLSHYHGGVPLHIADVNDNSITIRIND